VGVSPRVLKNGSTKIAWGSWMPHTSKKNPGEVAVHLPLPLTCEPRRRPLPNNLPLRHTESALVYFSFLVADCFVRDNDVHMNHSPSSSSCRSRRDRWHIPLHVCSLSRDSRLDYPARSDTRDLRLLPRWHKDRCGWVVSNGIKIVQMCCPRNGA
jgi:hypothetical protein